MPIFQPQRDTGLLPFLALAALLHALLFALPFALPSPDPERALKIALAQPAPAAAPATAPHPIRPPRPTAQALTAPAEPVTSAASAPPSSLAAAPLPAAETPPSRAEQESVRVLGQVRTALARHFTYPWLARRQGWQGEVLLGFSVTPEGRIDHVQVVRSSGHRLLDEAARTSLARIGHLPEYVSHGSESLSLQLPIIYRLAEG